MMFDVVSSVGGPQTEMTYNVLMGKVELTAVLPSVPEAVLFLSLSLQVISWKVITQRDARRRHGGILSRMTWKV